MVGLEFIETVDADRVRSPLCEVGAQVQRELDLFFSGSLRHFSAGFSLAESSDFQRRVLEECSRVEFGGRITYGELASRLGAPGASRAVGNALRHNPIALIIPCHRVTRSDGALGGYGGEDTRQRKKALLDLEQRALIAEPSAP